ARRWWLTRSLGPASPDRLIGGIPVLLLPNATRWAGVVTLGLLGLFHLQFAVPNFQFAAECSGSGARGWLTCTVLYVKFRSSRESLCGFGERVEKRVEDFGGEPCAG
ncbi:MAG: hypothetical protein M3500_13865, partial [Actinomycetota bacterium]|nr:hypothetical protein [Actinomycetota bacterium]